MEREGLGDEVEWPIRRDEGAQDELAGEDAAVLADRHPTISSRGVERRFSASPCASISGAARSSACRLSHAGRRFISGDCALVERCECIAALSRTPKSRRTLFRNAIAEKEQELIKM